MTVRESGFCCCCDNHQHVVQHQRLSWHCCLCCWWWCWWCCACANRQSSPALLLAECAAAQSRSESGTDGGNVLGVQRACPWHAPHDLHRFCCRFCCRCCRCCCCCCCSLVHFCFSSRPCESPCCSWCCCGRTNHPAVMTALMCEKQTCPVCQAACWCSACVSQTARRKCDEIGVSFHCQRPLPSHCCCFFCYRCYCCCSFCYCCCFFCYRCYRCCCLRCLPCGGEWLGSVCRWRCD